MRLRCGFPRILPGTICVSGSGFMTCPRESAWSFVRARERNSLWPIRVQLCWRRSSRRASFHLRLFQGWHFLGPFVHLKVLSIRTEGVKQLVMIANGGRQCVALNQCKKEHVRTDFVHFLDADLPHFERIMGYA